MVIAAARYVVEASESLCRSAGRATTSGTANHRVESWKVGLEQRDGGECAGRGEMKRTERLAEVGQCVCRRL